MKKSVIIGGVIILVLILGLFYLWPNYRCEDCVLDELFCESDSDCTRQPTSCNNCGCPEPINKDNLKELECDENSPAIGCTLECPQTIPKCIENECQLIEKTCAQAGDPTTNPPSPTGPIIEQYECCEGLTSITDCKRYEPNDELADENGCIIVVGCGSTCSDCGNGICEDWENRCNCEEDCTQ